MSGLQPIRGSTSLSFPGVWFSSGEAPSGSEDGWWFVGILHFTKVVCVCRRLRALLPISALTLGLKAFTQFLLLHNRLNSLFIRQTHIVLEVSEKEQVAASAKTN